MNKRSNNILNSSSHEMLLKIEAHPNNAVSILLSDLGWEPTLKGSNPSGSCVTGHQSESQTCMKIFSATNSCFCFSCQKKFFAIQIVMNLKSYDFKQALSYLADRAGIKLKSETTREIKTLIRSTERVQETLEAAAHYWHNNLLNNVEMMLILTTRYGLSLDSIKRNLIGLVDINSSTRSHLLNLGFTDEELQKAGIIFPPGHGFPREFFESRLVFPYIQGGRITYMIGRLTHLTISSNEKSSKSIKKYKKLPTATGEFAHIIDSSIIGDAIYGEDSIIDKENVIIAEGVTDCLSVQSLGYASISPATTGFSSKQFERLPQLLKNKNVVVTGDNEVNKAGEIGAWKTTEKLIECGIKVFFTTIPALDTSKKNKIGVPDVF